MSTSFFLQVVLFLFVLSTIAQLIYWLFIFSRFAHISDTEPEIEKAKKKEESVSIIICARNEEKKIKKNLPRILNQNYRSFEVIVVNDNSTDSTLNILLNYNIKDCNLRIINVDKKPKNSSGKKFALQKGILSAKYDLVLLTDADCYPNSQNWLREMQKDIHDPIKIGLGYGPYTKDSGLLNLFVRFETVYTAVQYFSFAIIGLPYMGVGRNLIYRKSLFKQVGGFKDHENITSGDDDLFINSVAKKSNVKIIINRDAFVYSDAKKTWPSYFVQKRRHLSTGRHYKMKHKVLLGLLSISHFLHYTGGILLVLAFNTSIMFVSLLYLVRILVVMAIYYPILKKLEETSLLKWIPFLDFIYLFYYLIFLPVVMLGKSQKWN